VSDTTVANCPWKHCSLLLPPALFQTGEYCGAKSDGRIGMTKEQKERMELSHKADPEYMTLFHIVLILAILYLGAVFFEIVSVIQ
jgi:hypothetical protein